LFRRSLAMLVRPTMPYVAMTRAKLLALGIDPEIL
jgi:hypothetical protein